LAVPQDRRFSLIRDADAGDVRRRYLGLRHDGAYRRNHSRPDFFRIMLDFAWSRVKLAQFFLRGGKRPQ